MGKLSKKDTGIIFKSLKKYDKVKKNEEAITRAKNTYQFRRIRAGIPDLNKKFREYDLQRIIDLGLNKERLNSIIDEFKNSYSDLFRTNTEIETIIEVYNKAKDEGETKIANQIFEIFDNIKTTLYYLIKKNEKIKNTSGKLIENVYHALDINKSEAKYELGQTLEEQAKTLQKTKEIYEQLVEITKNNY